MKDASIINGIGSYKNINIFCISSYERLSINSSNIETYTSTEDTVTRTIISRVTAKGTGV